MGKKSSYSGGINIKFREHSELLKQLIVDKVSFLLIGGYAVNFYGFNRPTGDMDIWLKPDNNNRRRFIKALSRLNFEEKSLKELAELDFSKANTFFIGTPPMRMDFLTKISNVRFKDAEAEREWLVIGGLKIPVIGLKHLVLSKISNERTKDKLDIEELQKIEKIRNSTNNK